MYPQFGSIYIADLPYIKNVQSGKRPVIIAQNNDGNAHASFTYVIPLTSKTEKAKHLPTHVVLTPNEVNGLEKRSIALVENTRPAPKTCLTEFVGHLCSEEQAKIGDAMKIQFPMMSL